MHWMFEWKNCIIIFGNVNVNNVRDSTKESASCDDIVLPYPCDNEPKDINW